MKNIGFEIKVNNQILCRAGFEQNDHVLTCILTTRVKDDEKDYTLNIGGLNSDTNEHVTWKHIHLKEGDHVNIELVQGPYDVPKEVRKDDAEEVVIQEKIKYFHKLKEELKDYLD